MDAQQGRVVRRGRRKDHKVTAESNVRHSFENRTKAVRALWMTEPSVMGDEDIVVAEQHSHALTVVATIVPESAGRLPPRSRNGGP